MESPALFIRGGWQQAGSRKTLPPESYSRTNHQTSKGEKSPSPHLHLKQVYNTCFSVGRILPGDATSSVASPTTFVSQGVYEMILPPEPSRLGRSPFERAETPSSVR